MEKKGGSNHGDTCWWHQEVKEAIRPKKFLYKRCARIDSREIRLDKII